MADGVLVYFMWLGAILRAADNEVGEVRAACDHNIDEFTDAITVHETHLLRKGILKFNIWAAFSVENILHHFWSMGQWSWIFGVV